MINIIVILSRANDPEVSSPLSLIKRARGISFLLYAHNKCGGVSEAVSKWFSQLRLLGIVSLSEKTILKRPPQLRQIGHSKKEIPLAHIS